MNADLIREKIAYRKQLGMTADQFNFYLRAKVDDARRQYDRAIAEVLGNAVLRNSLDRGDDLTLECLVAEERWNDAVAEAKRFGAL